MRIEYNKTRTTTIFKYDKVNSLGELFKIDEIQTVYKELENSQKNLEDKYQITINKVNQIDKNLVIDSLEIARNKFPGTSNSLDALCKKFNVDLSRRTKSSGPLSFS